MHSSFVVEGATREEGPRRGPSALSTPSEPKLATDARIKEKKKRISS